MTDAAKDKELQDAYENLTPRHKAVVDAVRKLELERDALTARVAEAEDQRDYRTKVIIERAHEIMALRAKVAELEQQRDKLAMERGRWIINQIDYANVLKLQNQVDALRSAGPRERIAELIPPMRMDTDWVEAQLKAIIQYLDEQAEK